MHRSVRDPFVPVLFQTVSLGSSVNRPSVSMLTLSRQLWHLVEREEDLVGLYAHLLCRSGKLVGSWNGASQLTLTECLSGLFLVKDVATAEGPAVWLVAVVLLHQTRYLTAEAWARSSMMRCTSSGARWVLNRTK